MHTYVADYDSNRLFWVDAKLHVIFTSDFNGQNRQVVLTSYNNLVHPFSVAVFEVRWRELHLTDIFVIATPASRGDAYSQEHCGASIIYHESVITLTI